MLFFSQLLPSTNTGGGTGTVSTNGTLAYSDRGDLRTTEGTAGDMVVVEGLGMFQYYEAPDLVDDDETCFRKGVDGWVMTLPAWDKVYSNLAGELGAIAAPGFLHIAELPTATIVAGASVTFSAESFGALSDVLVGHVANNNALTVTMSVTDTETISITVFNQSAVSQSTEGLSVQYSRLKGVYQS